MPGTSDSSHSPHSGDATSHVHHVHLISTAEEISALADTLRQHSVIAFDTEFIRESTFFPIVEIIQVATATQAWIVDAQAFKKAHRVNDPKSYDPAIQPLLDVFTDPKILKIVHAAQGDQECLCTSFGVTAKPSIDTAVAASLCGMGDAIGLGKLLKQVLDVSLAKGHARTNWSVRPLPPQLAEYALADVEYLVELGTKLLEMLESSGRRAWALDLSAKFENTALYGTDIDGIAERLSRGGRLDRKSTSVLKCLVEWRERRVRQLNLPRKWVAEDAVLVDLARVRPKDMDHLASFRGINKGELRNQGQAILNAIQTGLDNAAQNEKGESGAQSHKHHRIDAASPHELQLIELLKCYINILAERNQIAARHLISTSQLLPLIRLLQSPNFNLKDLEKSGLLSGESALLIGEELGALLSGKRALTVKNGQVEISKL